MGMGKIERLRSLVVLALVLYAGTSFAAESEKSYRIGIVQHIENNAFLEMREGFLSRMKELGYGEDRLSVDYKNAQGDIGTLNAICQGMAREGLDLIVTIATPATQAMVNTETETPIIFVSVANPVAAGVLSTMEKPDKNATGTSNLIPVDRIFELAEQLTPGVKTYGILYNLSETNAVSTVNKAKEYLDGKGIAYKEATVANSSEVQQAAQSLIGNVDALYIPVDSMVQTAMPQVAQLAVESKIPVYGSSPVMVSSGALATVSVSDTKIGGMSADMADRYFKGTPIADIPSVRLEESTVVINAATAEAIGVKVPESLSSAAFIGK